ncbi:unnamed protein product [Brassica rapa subsp. narinosa]
MIRRLTLSTLSSAKMEPETIFWELSLLNSRPLSSIKSTGSY